MKYNILVIEIINAKGGFYMNKNNINKINVAKIIFYIAVLCWIIYFASGIFAFFFGSNTGGGLLYPTREYGITALKNTLFWNLITFSLIPVLPLSLIYIIIYIVVRKKNEKNSSDKNND